MSLVNFVPNETGTAFLKCDGKIKTDDEYYSISPYADGGEKRSRRVYKSELGISTKPRASPKKAVRELKGRKVYSGDKIYQNSRIAYPKCYKRKPDAPVLPQKYNDVASNAEAFERAEKLFHSGGPKWWLTSSSSLATRTQPVISDRPTSQLLDEKNYNALYVALTSSKVPTSSFAPARREEKIPTRISRTSVVETDPLDGKKYMAYPHTNVYFSCPSAERKLSLEEVRRRLTDYKAQQAAAGNDLKGKKFYCGREIEDLVKAKMCGLLPASVFQELGLELEELGSPGQCFQYGKQKDLFPLFTHDW